MPQSEEENLSKRKLNLVSDQVVIDKLAKAVFEVLKEESQKEREPFESYAQQLKLRLHADIKIYQERLSKGYEALLESLNSTSLT